MRSEPDGKLVDQRDCSAKAAFCSATRILSAMLLKPGDYKLPRKMPSSNGMLNRGN